MRLTFCDGEKANCVHYYEPQTEQGIHGRENDRIGGSACGDVHSWRFQQSREKKSLIGWNRLHRHVVKCCGKILLFHARCASSDWEGGAVLSCEFVRVVDDGTGAVNYLN